MGGVEGMEGGGDGRGGNETGWREANITEG